MKTLAGDMPQFPRYAENEQEATHKFPTYVHWGDGYFDGMRHIVADTDIAAYSVMKNRLADSDWHNLWRRGENGEWVNCMDLKEKT